MLDKSDPETAIRKQAEEELGYRLDKIERLFSPYMSPGSVTERLWFFVAAIRPPTASQPAAAPKIVSIERF